MSELADQNIERLSHLFATGNLSHAQEIARLLGQEIGEQPRERCESGLISRLLAAAAFVQTARLSTSGPIPADPLFFK